MARCKLTSMNLRNIRKTREYQCLIIDLVNAGVVTKSAAETLLGYTIPAGLLTAGSTTPVDDDDETGGEGTGGEGTGGEGTGGETGGETGGGSEDTITLNILGGIMYDDSGLNLDEYTLYNPSGTTPIQVQVPASLVAALNTKFNDTFHKVAKDDEDFVAFVNILKTAVDAAAAECGASDSSVIYEARMCTADTFIMAKAAESDDSWSIGNVYYAPFDTDAIVRTNNNTDTDSGDITDGDTYFVSIEYANTDGE